MNLHKMIEICLKDDNMHIFVMINALICINNYVITCIISMLSRRHFPLFLMVIFFLNGEELSNFFIVIQALAQTYLIYFTLSLQQDFSLLEVVVKKIVETHSFSGS